DGNLAWSKTRKYLEAAGHQVWTPTITGQGKAHTKEEIAAAQSHASAVQSIQDYIMKEDLSDFVLIGHSFGGSIIQQLAYKMPECIKCLVFQNAFMLEDQQCLNDMMPPPVVAIFDTLAAASGNNTFAIVFKVWRDVVISDGDYETVKRIYEMLGSQPYGQYQDKLPNKDFT